MEEIMYKIEPVFKDYIWGGERLRKEYGKESELEIVAESWELSTHPSGICSIVVDTAKENLSDYIKKYGKSVLGEKCEEVDEIPILIKLIDAKDNLSVQVHPDDAYAKKHENDLGKTEMWYVLEAEEGAQLVYGFKENLTKETFKESIERNTLSQYLNYVDVHKGDVFFINPGTMHAIGKGIVIAEIQESSNVTYRVYDYGRMGIDGKHRALHVDKALEVTCLTKEEESNKTYEMVRKEGAYVGILANCKYFTVSRIQLEENLNLLADDSSFQHLLIVEGEVVIEKGDKQVVGHKGDSFFVPAHLGEYKVSGKGEIILSTL